MQSAFGTCAATHVAAQTMDSDSSDDLPLDPRRQRAIQLLAKALHKEPSGADGPPSSAPASAAVAEEASFLRSLLELRSASKVHRLVQDRLSVLSVRSGEVEVRASAPPGRDRAAPADDDGGATPVPAEPARDVRAVLEAVQAGDLSGIAPRALLQEFWHGECAHTAGAATAPPQPSGPLPVPAAALAAASDDLSTRGYACIEPGGGWTWGARGEAALGRLEVAARALAARGWPPLFLFMLDDAWDVLDLLWESMGALLGDGCRMDPSTFCWIARRFSAEAEPKSPTAGDGAGTAPSAAAGANFGLPHRDFTYLQSQVAKAEAVHVAPEAKAGAVHVAPEAKAEAVHVAQHGSAPPLVPALLSVWLPLSGVSSDNGCMMVVPRALDRPFTKRWAYAHMRPALPGDDDGVTEVRFDLQATARPRTHTRPPPPLRAGLSARASVIRRDHMG